MKNSDNSICLKNVLKNFGWKLSIIVTVMVFSVGFAAAQEPIQFIEGSEHSFSVENNPLNTFQWSMDIDPYNNVDLDPTAYDLLIGGNENAVTVKFNDMNRVSSELVYLVVEEMAPNGCSTKRAQPIELLPNNMYFDFAQVPNADACYNYGDDYIAEVQVGMNFLDRNGASDYAIPEDRFPLEVKYTVENKTDISVGLVERTVTVNYSSDNTYMLNITDAKGEIDRTIEYELVIAEVTDVNGTSITHDETRRMQIRIMKHLPQTNPSMDMAMAYVITPVRSNTGF